MREPLGGSGGMLPQKNLKSRDLEMLFLAFFKSYLWFTHTANYLLRTLSQQTNAYWEYNTCNVNFKIENQLSLYLETRKCYLTVWVPLEANVDFIGRSFFENFPNSCLIIVYFEQFIQVCFYLLGKKLGGHGPPRPLPLLRHCLSKCQSYHQTWWVQDLTSSVSPSSIAA